MTTPADKVSDWLLERLAAGELPPGQAEELRRSLAARGENDRLAAIAASNAEILAVLPAERVVPEIERRAAAQRRPSPRVRPLFALSLAAAAAGLLVAVATRHGAVPPAGEEGTGEYRGIKGLAPSLRIHRQTKAGPELLRPGSLVRKGDMLQVGYLAAGKRFGVIASIDARGTVTLHLPEAPGPAATLARGGERALPHAYELDDAPGFERFVFAFSDAPFATADVVAALEHGRAWPAGLAIYELTLKKATP
jgi:hypothetical protein